MIVVIITVIDAVVLMVIGVIEAAYMAVKLVRSPVNSVWMAGTGSGQQGEHTAEQAQDSDRSLHTIPFRYQAD